MNISAYARKETFGGMINMYKSEVATPGDYKPLEVIGNCIVLLFKYWSF